MAKESNDEDHIYARPYARLSLFDSFEDDELEMGNGLPPRPIRNIPPDDDELGLGYELPPRLIRNIPPKDDELKLGNGLPPRPIKNIPPPPKDFVPKIRTPTRSSKPFILTVDGIITAPRARSRKDVPRNNFKSPPRTLPNSTVPIIPSPLSTLSFPPPSVKEEVIEGEGAKSVPKLENVETQVQHEEPGPPKKMGLGASSPEAAQNPPGDGETVKAPPMAPTATQREDETPNYCGACEMKKELKEIKSMLMSLVVRMSNVEEKF